MQGRIDALVLGAGSGGTFTGVSRFFKERRPGLLSVLVESEGSVYGGGQAAPHRVEGIGNSFIPKILDRSLIDGSSGAVACAAAQVAGRLGPGKTIVTLFSDGSERYLSQGIYDEVT